MNISQLERIKTMFSSIRAELETDGVGAMWLNADLDKVEDKINEELKNLLWKRYLEAEDRG